MDSLAIRYVRKEDLDNCYAVEISCFAPSAAATKDRIKLRIETFPQGFLVAEINGKIVGMINSSSINEESLADEALTQMANFVPDGKNVVVFSLCVLPEFRGKEISRRLLETFIELSKKLGKKKILLLCKENLIKYYEKFGFTCLGKSKSQHGGFEYYEMSFLLK